MESIQPTQLTKFTINTSGKNFSVLLNASIFTKKKLLNTFKLVLKLDAALILTAIMYYVINKSGLHDKYIANVSPASIKIRNIKINTRKLIEIIIKYLLLAINFIIINMLL